VVEEAAVAIAVSEPTEDEVVQTADNKEADSEDGGPDVALYSDEYYVAYQVKR
jgi:hypothetical protein